MKNRVTIILVLILSIAFAVNAQSKHTKTTKYTSYKGLVMAGYQGWFRAEGDGAKRGFAHYSKNGKFEAESNTIDFWPDVSDYKKTYKTNAINT